jgi:hypothetical protein
MLDFMGYIIERTMRSLDNRLAKDDIIPLVKNLVLRYPKSRQKE